MFTVQSKRTRSYRTAILVSAAALVGTFACGDEEIDANIAEQPGLVSATGVFTRTGGEVVIAVSPRDENGEFVGQNLPRSAFSFENVRLVQANRVQNADAGVQLEMEVTSLDVTTPNPDAVLEAVVVFDSSGSMSGNDPGAVGRRAGGAALLDILRDGDQLAVIDFGAGVTSPLRQSRLLQDFTDDQELLAASLDRLTQSGGTPLYESILDGLGLLDEREGELEALVVLTDGQAGNTNLLDDAIEKAQEQGTPIFAIGLGQSLDYSDLTRLADETEGGFVEAGEAAALEQAFSGVSSGLRLGRVLVHGKAEFSLPPGTGGLIRVEGDLVTRDGANHRYATPFSFTTELSTTLTRDQ